MGTAVRKTSGKTFQKSSEIKTIDNNVFKYKCDPFCHHYYDPYISGMEFFQAADWGSS